MGDMEQRMEPRKRPNTEEQEGEDPLGFRKVLERAPTMSIEDAKTFSPSDEAPILEQSGEEKLINLEEVVRTVKVQGFDLKRPPEPSPEAERRALEKADPFADHRRNRKYFAILCPTCLGKKKCVHCGGRGRRYLIFKCTICEGSGKCPDCDRDIDVECPKCGSPMNLLSDSCLRCGNFFACISCGATTPALATRCMSCGAIGLCGTCGKPMAIQFSRVCPHCGAFNKGALVKP